MDKRQIFRRLTIAGVVVFTLIVVAVFVRQGRIASRAREWSEHSYMVREQIQRVFIKVKDVELGQRGYVLSGDSAYLQAYNLALYGQTGGPGEAPHGQAGLRLWDEVRILREHVVDNPEQTTRADSLEALVRQRALLAAALIRLRRLRGQEAAIAEVKQGGGKRLMDETRALVNVMLGEEERLLADRRESEEASLRVNGVLLYSMVGLFYLAWLFSLRMAGRDRRRRLLAEKDLREQHAHLEALVNSGGYAIFSTDAHGKVTLFNPAAESMLGYSAAEVVGHRASDVLAGIHDRNALELRRKKLAEKHGRPVRGMDLFTLPLEGTGKDRVWTLIRRDGSRFPVSMTVSPMRGKDGTAYGHMAIVKDITERRRMERSLEESNALFRTIIDGTEYAVFASDAKGKITIFNRAAAKMLGQTEAEIVGLPALDLIERLLPEEREARAAKLAEKYGRPPSGIELITLPIVEDAAIGQQWTFMHPRLGKHIPVAMSVSEMRDHKGRFIGHVALARDITELQANERIKNEFISTVSHELRTPLTSIRGALGLIAGGAMGALPPKAGELIAIAHRNSERLVHIINDILDIEKIESGKMAMQLRRLEVAGFLRQAVDMNQGYGDKFDVRFLLKDAPDGLFVNADPDRLMQIMANFLSNAAKFSPAGSEVWVGAAVLQDGRGSAVRFTIRDFGKGIPESFRDRIFGKFAQAEGTDTRNRDGTGLGLNITKKLVEAMQGIVGFETEVGKGTEFFFELPLASAASEGAGTGAAEARPRVLICEDDHDVGTLLRVLLERAGLHADVCRTLAETRARLAENVYAALTLDLILPDGSGLTLLRELRRDPRTQELPVIVVSAGAEEGRRELNGDAIGMIDWMTKPIDEEQLGRSLRRAVAGGSRPRILHVEDDADFRQVLERSLQDKAEWVGAATLGAAEALLRQGRFDLVVLDIDLPDGSGLQLLERLRAMPGEPIPVLILSASEMENGVRQRVEAALVKSRLSEERIVETILEQIRKRSRPPGEGAP